MKNINKKLIFVLSIIILGVNLAACEENSTGEQVLDNEGILSQFENKGTDIDETLDTTYIEETTVIKSIEETIGNNAKVDNLISKLQNVNTNDSLLQNKLSYQIFFYGKHKNQSDVVYLEGYTDRQGSLSYRAKTPSYNSEYTSAKLPYMVNTDGKAYTLVEGNNTSPISSRELYNDYMRHFDRPIKVITGRDTLFPLCDNAYTKESLGSGKSKITYITDDINKDNYDRSFSDIQNIKSIMYEVTYDDNTYIIDDILAVAVISDQEVYTLYDMKILYDVSIPTAVKTVRDEANGEVVYFDLSDIEKKNIYSNLKKDINSIYFEKNIKKDPNHSGKNWTFTYYNDVDGNMVIRDIASDEKNPYSYVKCEKKWYKCFDNGNISPINDDMKMYELDPTTLATGNRSFFETYGDTVTSYEDNGKGIIVKAYADNNINYRKTTTINMDNYAVEDIELVNNLNGENVYKLHIEYDVNEPDALYKAIDYIDMQAYSDDGEYYEEEYEYGEE